jgi:hypothetical protein
MRSLPLLLLLQHPVEWRRQHGAGIEPDAAMAAQQFETNPVGTQRGTCMLQRLRQFAQVVAHAVVVQHPDAEMGIELAPVGKAARNEWGRSRAAPVGPDNRRDRPRVVRVITLIGSVGAKNVFLAGSIDSSFCRARKPLEIALESPCEPQLGAVTPGQGCVLHAR